MQIGIIGLGRMGGNMARRLMKAGHQLRRFRRQRQDRARRWRKKAPPPRGRWQT